jgi:hypothetical protein
MSDLKALGTLIGGYLNEDWPEDYGDPWAAVEAFVRYEPGYAPAVRSDVEQLVAEQISDREVEKRLAKFGLGYRPSVDGSIMYRTWLLDVADRVDELLHRSPAA